MGLGCKGSRVQGAQHASGLCVLMEALLDSCLGTVGRQGNLSAKDKL